MVFGANFALQQDNLKAPNGQYEYLGINVPSYGLQEKTSNLPSLDISATLTPTKKDRNWKGEWVLVFIIYITGKAAINFRQNADSGNNEAVKPLSSNSSAVSYNFKF
jgi:hypothetical protein